MIKTLCRFICHINVTIASVLYRVRIFFKRLSLKKVSITAFFRFSYFLRFAHKRRRHVFYFRDEPQEACSSCASEVHVDFDKCDAPCSSGQRQGSFSRRRRTSARRINPIPPSHEKQRQHAPLHKSSAPKCARGGLSAQKHVILALPSISSLFRLPLGIISGCIRLLPG